MTATTASWLIPGDVLVEGADFYSDPIVSPDGRFLAWLEWRHPNMPWDGTELWVAMFKADGSIGAREHVAGGRDESIFQPEWSADGRLYFVSDRTGWWNLYRWSGADVEAVHPMQAEFGKPQWTFSMVTYAFVDRDRIAATYTEDGRWKLGADRHRIENIQACRSRRWNRSSPSRPEAARCISSAARQRGLRRS